MVQNLLKNCKIMQIQNGSAAGTTAVTSNTIDTAGYNAVCCIASLGTVTSGAVIQLNAQEGAQSGGGDATTITGGSTPSVTDAGTSSNKILITDVLRLTQRYFTANLTRTTQNVVVNCMIAILYQTDNIPVTLDTSVLASVLESGN